MQGNVVDVFTVKETLIELGSITIKVHINWTNYLSIQGIYLLGNYLMVLLKVFIFKSVKVPCIWIRKHLKINLKEFFV